MHVADRFRRPICFPFIVIACTMHRIEIDGNGSENNIVQRKIREQQ